jgi:hypothetical protein
MFNKTKTLIVAAVMAVSAVSAAPANAQSARFSFHDPNFSIEIGPRHHRPYYRGHRRGHDRGYDRGYHRRAVCSPQEAVYKARRHGMRHAGIQRMRPRAIVVTGWHRGHRARMVFERYSRHCRVIASRGIR